MITHDRLLELVHYDPDTGIFTNKVRRNNISPIGKVLGTKNASGHLVAQLDKKMYLLHRLAWFYCFKEWPEDILDHIDRNPENNRLDNLREATKVTNSYNSRLRKDNTSGIKGVYFDKRRNLFYSQIVANKQKTFLGYFETKEAAAKAYSEAAKLAHGEFINEDTIYG